jgi:hypothetical protein
MIVVVCPRPAVCVKRGRWGGIDGPQPTLRAPPEIPIFAAILDGGA